jgi:hypothetical protein
MTSAGPLRWVTDRPAPHSFQIQSAEQLLFPVTTKENH